MSRRPIQWGGEVIANLIETDDGRRYLAPPIVFDTDGNVIFGAEVLVAVVESGVTLEAYPVLRNYRPGDLAGLDQKLARVAEALGVDFGPAGVGGK